MLYLGNILLRYVLIYNRSRSVFQFSLDISTINCDENVVKTVFFSLLLAIFFEVPIWGVDCTINQSYKVKLVHSKDSRNRCAESLYPLQLLRMCAMAGSRLTIKG